MKKDQKFLFPLLPAAILIMFCSTFIYAIELPLKKIVLYSNGVAYCERRGQVTGDAEINLAFKKDQISDVLKSLVVIDRDGTVETVSYNLSSPPRAKLVDIPFHIDSGTESDDATGGLYSVLKQLQGSRIRVQMGTQSFEGAVLTVTRQSAQYEEKAPHVTTEFLTIAGADGTLRSFKMSDIRSVQLLEDGVRNDVKQFTEIVSQARSKEVQTLVISTSGKGSRELVIGYVVSAPIWKSNYRVVMDKSGKPFFQGWALIDNTSDEDWKDISMTLVSGSPLSFIYSIQHPLYKHRPVLPLPPDVSMTPQVVEEEEWKMVNSYWSRGSGGGSGVGFGSGSAGGIGSGIGPSVEDSHVPGQPMTSISDALARGEAGIKAAATGKEVGDLFEYTIENPVSLARNHSALIPILQQTMEGERISIFNAGTQKDRPLGGILLKNTSPLTLESGTLTILEDDSYAGEAILERLKPGEVRLVGFSTDLATLVHREMKDSHDPVRLVRALKGSLELHYYRVQNILYTIQNQTEHPRTLYLEHPILKDWTLGPGGALPFEKTDKFYRYRLELGPHAEKTLNVLLHYPMKDNYRLAELTADNVELLISKNYLDESQQQMLRQILDINLQIALHKVQEDRAIREHEEITKDQERLRENIKTIKENREGRKLLARYVNKAAEQENRLEALEKQRQECLTSQEQLKQKVITLIKDFSLEREIESGKL
jgi:hypothetical protein